MYKHWEIKKVNKTNDGTVISIEIVDKEYQETFASFKWDGCVNYTEYLNGFKVDDEYSEEKKNNSQYIHLCDINKMIDKLQEIKKIAEENFSPQNYSEYWE